MLPHTYITRSGMVEPVPERQTLSERNKYYLSARGCLRWLSLMHACAEALYAHALFQQGLSPAPAAASTRLQSTLSSSDTRLLALPMAQWPRLSPASVILGGLPAPAPCPLRGSAQADHLAHGC